MATPGQLPKSIGDTVYAGDVRGVSTGTVIKASDFEYGGGYVGTVIRAGDPLFYVTWTLSANTFTTNLNVVDMVTAAGWDGINRLDVTVNVNGVLGSTSTNHYAFDTGSSNLFSKLTVNVGTNGVITGCGGGTWQQTTIAVSPNLWGGTDNNIGTVAEGFPCPGGPAMRLQTSTIIVNSGIIQGGCGAGGPGDNIFFGAGAGYYYGDAGPQVNANDGVSSLYSGGPYQYNSSGHTTNGGAGGGWVSGSGASASIDGWGYGSPSGGGGPGTVDGGAPPGNAIDGYSLLNLTGSSLGNTTYQTGAPTGNSNLVATKPCVRGKLNSPNVSTVFTTYTYVSSWPWTYAGTDTSFRAVSLDGVSGNTKKGNGTVVTGP